MAEKFDVVVIGAGPGGYVAAIRCAQLGMKVACADQWVAPNGNPVLGGTCLNVGCIPSKALLDSSHHYEFITKKAKEHGIQVEGLSIDIAKMMARKEKIVRTLTQGIAGLFKKHHITWIQGRCRLSGNTQVEVSPIAAGGEAKTVDADRIIVATGSAPIDIPQAPVDQDLIVDSTGALCFDAVPERLGVIGAGVIGVELGSVWRRLGSQVVLFEALESFLPAVDHEIAQAALAMFGKQGMDIRLSTRVTGTSAGDGEIAVEYEADGEPRSERVNRLIVSVGRRPDTKALNLGSVGIATDAQGFIKVDEFCRTNVPNIYAIGDVVRGPMLAHKASEEGIAVAEHINGLGSRVNHATVPGVIYTWPEIAWVGKSEQELEREGIKYRTGSFPFAGNGRARAMGDPEGMVKIIGEAQTDRILGVHILGPNASELISEAVLAMEFDGSTEDIARTIHAHPTLSEAVHEAALAVDGRPLHI